MKTLQVKISKGVTVNLGNYENIRLDVEVTMQVGEGEDWGAVVEEAASEAEAGLVEQMTQVMGGLPNHQIAAWERRLPMLHMASRPDEPIPFGIGDDEDDEAETDTRELDTVDDDDDIDGDEGFDPDDYPATLFDGLEAIRASGKVNMLDRKRVIELMWLTHPVAASWLEDPSHQDRYMDALNELGQKQ